MFFYDVYMIDIYIYICIQYILIQLLHPIYITNFPRLILLSMDFRIHPRQALAEYQPSYERSKVRCNEEAVGIWCRDNCYAAISVCCRCQQMQWWYMKFMDPPQADAEGCCFRNGRTYRSHGLSSCSTHIQGWYWWWVAGFIYLHDDWSYGFLQWACHCR